jgi:protein involved in polysaccharide export with SLBB domain
VALSLDKAIDNPGKDNDIVLAAGDEIIIPPTPHTVKVAGAVSFPTSIVWEKGKSLGDYVSRAGGYIDGADKWKTHVVYPNGMSKQIRHRWFDPGVMPGSVIVVPTQNPDNGDSKLSTLKEVASIFASIATVWLVIDRTQ